VNAMQAFHHEIEEHSGQVLLRLHRSSGSNRFAIRVRTFAEIPAFKPDPIGSV
jgi:hypothetical protein